MSKTKKGRAMKTKQPVQTYEYTWRNKWLTAEAKTIDDMIDGLQAAADELRAMKVKGVTLLDTPGTQDDYAFLVTNDPAVAKEFGFEPPDDDDLDDEEAALNSIESHW